VYAKLEAELNEPSLYDEAIRLAARRGIAMPEEVISRDVRQTHALHDGVTEGWKMIYEAIPKSTGRSTRLQRSWWISRTISAAGASTMSPPWSG
jgi:tryptophan 2,3-dioxygenase